MKLIPGPKELKFEDNPLYINQLVCDNISDYPYLNDYISTYFLRTNENLKPNVIFTQKLELSEDEYTIIGKSNMINITYHGYSSLLYAIYSLKQIQNEIPKTEFFLHDFPNLKIRGYMLDISRNKIPKIIELKKLIEQLSFLRINHFELYVEGFSFYDDSYPDAPYNTPLTLTEFIDLQEFASHLAVDLVPNINGLGHMTSWLELSKYKHLAEKEDGFIAWGFPFKASTLNPSNEESFVFVKQLYQPLLKASNSSYFHMNLDEPFELGEGKNKDLCQKIGKGIVYLKWVNRLAKHVQSYHLKPMMWADVIFSHLDLISKLPKDIIYCDWGYDSGYPFETHAEILENAELDFLLCPGTSSWNSFTSRYNDMYQTTIDSCKAAINHHGLGVMTTDWGDFGHLQPLSVSYIGIVTLAYSAWNTLISENIIEIVSTVFSISKDKVTSLYQLSKYSLLEDEYTFNATMTFQTLMFTDPDLNHPIQVRYLTLQNALKKRKFSFESYLKISQLLDQIKKELIDDKSIEYLEIRTMIDLIEICSFIQFNIVKESIMNQDIIDKLTKIEKTISSIWKMRNKESYLNESLKRIISLKEIIDYQMK